MSLPLQLVKIAVFLLCSLIVLPIILPFVTAFALCLIGYYCFQNAVRVRYDLPLPDTWTPPQPEERWLTTSDGVKLRYLIVRPKAENDSGRVILLCQPLGHCGLKIYHPFLAIVQDATFVTFDYRGFFHSDEPERLRNVSIRDHARDAREVLAAAVGEGRAADACVGYSMGVQVALEFTLLYPKLCNSLCLINGTSGHAMQSGFQPLVRLPYVGDIISEVMSIVLRSGQEYRIDAIRAFFYPILRVFFPIITRLFGSPVLRKLMGENYHFDFWKNYVGGVCLNRKSMRSFLRGFQELDAHSCDHLLWQIKQPALVIGGLFDFLTPVYCSARLAARLKNSRLVIDPLSTHATIIEHPERVLGEFTEFLKRANNFKRVPSKSDFSFEEVEAANDEARASEKTVAEIPDTTTSGSSAATPLKPRTNRRRKHNKRAKRAPPLATENKRERSTSSGP